MYLIMRAGSHYSGPQEPEADRERSGPSIDPRSTEDLRPHILGITVCPSQQEKEGGPIYPRPKGESPKEPQATGS